MVLSAGLGSLGAAAGSIRLLSEDGAELVRLATEGYTAAMLAASPARLPLDAPVPVSHAARAGEAVFLASQGSYDRRFPAAGAPTSPAATAPPPSCRCWWAGGSWALWR